MRTRVGLGLWITACVLGFAAAAVAEPQLTPDQARQVLAALQTPEGRQVESDSRAVGTLLDRVAGIGPPDMPVVKKLAQMKSLLGGEASYTSDPQLQVIETTIMRRIFGAALKARTEALKKLSPADIRRFFAFGDVGSWGQLIAGGSPQYSTDMDFTLFSVDGSSDFETHFNEIFSDELELSSKSVLPESCGVVVTRPGNEGGAGVFVTRAGKEWVRQSAMKFKRLMPDGTEGRQIPHDDLRIYAFDAALAVDADLAPFVNDKGRIADMSEDSPEFRRFVDVIVRKYPNLGYEKMTAGKATGGIADMMVHNVHEAMRASELGWEGRAARSTKYGLRGSEIFRRGMAEAKDGRASWNALLGDANQELMKQLFELDKVRQDPKAFNVLFAKFFGPPTTEAMKTYSQNVQNLLTQQSRISHTYHMKQIVGVEGVAGKAARSKMLQAALDDYRKVEAEMVRYDAPEADLDHQRSLIQEAEALRLMNDAGDLLLLDDLRKLYDETTPRQRKGLLGFLRKTPKGSELGEIMKPYLDEDSRLAIKARLLNEGATLDYVKTVLVNPAMEQAALVKDRVDLGVEGIQFTLACAKAYVEADLTKGSAEWQTAQAIAREAALRRWPLVAIGLGAYTAAQQGDVAQLLKLLAMYLCPWSAIPDTVKSLGDMGKDIALTIAFEGLLDSLYARSTFSPSLDEAEKMWGFTDDVLSKASFRFVSVNSLGSDYEGEAGVKQLIDDILFQGRADSWRPAESGNELAAGWARIWNQGTVHAIRSMLQTGKHTLFKGDPGMATLLKKLVENEKELRCYEKNPAPAVWLGTVVPLGFDVKFADDRTRVKDWGSLPRGAAEENVLDLTLKQRREIKQAAQDRLAALIIASFQSRRRTDFIQRTSGQGVDSALQERLEKLAAKLHVDAPKLVRAAQKAYAAADSSLADDRKDKAAVVVDQWVNAYEAIVSIKQKIVERGLKFGVPAGVLQGPAGPLSRSPPFVFLPEPDLAFARKAEADVKHLPASVFALFNHVAGVKGLQPADDPRAIQRLRRLRFEILVLEQWFAGVDGIDWSLWRKLEAQVFADDAFAERVAAEAARTRSWWSSVEETPGQRDLLLEQLREKASEYNRLVNELRTTRQTAVSIVPAPLVLAPDAEGVVTLQPKHVAADFWWALAKPVPGIALTPGRGRVEKGEPTEITVRVDPDAPEGIRRVELRLEARLAREHPKVQWTAREQTATIVLSVGPPPPRAVEVLVLVPDAGGAGELPVEGAVVSIRSPKRRADLEALGAKGTYGAPSVFPGAYDLTVRREGSPDHREQIIVPVATSDEAPWKRTVRLPGSTETPPAEKRSPLVLRTVVPKADGTIDSHRGAFHVVFLQNGVLVAEADGSGGEHTLPMEHGLYEIRVTAKGMKEWRGSSDVQAKTVVRVVLERDLAVELPPEKTVLFKVSPVQLIMEPGQTMVFKASAVKMKGPVTMPVRLSEGDVTWTSSNPAVASVSGTGPMATVEATQTPGRARITATYGQGADEHKAHAEVTVVDAAAMDFQIRLDPEGQRFAVGQEITFRAVSPMSPPPTWQWFIGPFEETAAVVRKAFSEAGTYTIRLLATHPVTGATDAVSRSITIEDRAKPTAGGGDPAGTGDGPPDGADTGTGTDGEGGVGTPLARRRNEFRLVANAQGKATHVEARGWRDAQIRWSKWQLAKPLPENDDVVLTFGDQAEGCNTGWLVFSRTGTGRLEFHAMGYDFGRLSATTSHQGTVDLRGKRFRPGSLRAGNTASRAAEFECRMTDGTLCRMRIWKTPEVSSSNVMTKGGVEILEWIPPRAGSGTGSGDEKDVPPSALDLGAVGVRLFQDHGWDASVPGGEVKLSDVSDGAGKTFQLSLIAVRGKNERGDTGEIRFLKMANESDAAAYLKALEDMVEPAPGGRVASVRLMGSPAFYATSPPSNGKRQSQELGWHQDDVIFLLRLRREKLTENIQDWAKKLHSMVFFARRGELPGFEPPADDGPRIERLIYKSSVWPVRLQDGVLDVQGCGYPGYEWRTAWITLSQNAKDFRGGASGQGPLVAFTEDGKRWKVIELKYDTGARSNERTFDAPVTIIRPGKRGCVIEAGGRHYDFSQGQCREIDPKTGNYVRR